MQQRWGIPFALGLAVALFVAAPAARAGWQGKISLEEPGRGQKIEGKIYFAFPKVRMDTKMAGQDTSVITDIKTRHSVMLMHSRKMMMEMQPKDSPSRNFLSCQSEDIDGCLKSKGYKKVGAETIDGHPCAIYEGDESAGGHPVHQKIWRPTDLKQVFMLKSESRLADGQVGITRITDVKMGAVNASLFAEPTGYQKFQMPNMAGFQGMGRPGAESQLPPGHPPVGGPGPGAPGAPGPGAMPAGMPQLPPGIKLPPGVTLPPGFVPPNGAAH